MSRIAIFSPAPSRLPCGNNTTLRRISSSLRAQGHHVEAVHLGDARANDSAWIDGSPLSRFDILHALHAFKTGPRVLETARALDIPYVVSATGTDLNEDLECPERRGTVLDVLRNAAAVLVPSPDLEEMIRGRARVLTPCVVVPKGVEVEDLRDREDPARVVFLHVGGWRKVKNNLFALEPLAKLVREIPAVELRFLGPVIDPECHARWERIRDRYPFAVDGGLVEPEGMAAEFAAASVVLNTSHSEGGANAILEAMAFAKPVLASNVPGNAALVRHDDSWWETSTGVLYRTERGEGGGTVGIPFHDPEDFHRKARRLALEKELRRAIGSSARRFVMAEHSPLGELRKILEAYAIAGVA